MLRTSVCLLMVLLAGAPAAAKSGTAARPGDVTAVAAAYGVITSTYRSPAHNRAVGGVPNSYHLIGRAIDIARKPGVTHRQIANALEAAGYRLVESLDEGDHSHFAFGAPTAAPEKGRVRIAAVADKPTPPPPKVVPLLRADEHGTLLLDLAAGTSAADGREPGPGGQAAGDAP